MSGVASWVLDHLWALLLGLCFIVVLSLSFVVEGVAMRWLVRAARSSRWRAAGATVAFHAALLTGWALAAVLAIAVNAIVGSQAAAAWIPILAVVVLLPWSLPFLPTPGSTIRRNLTDRGASKEIALVIALTGVPFVMIEMGVAFGAVAAFVTSV